MISEKTLNLNKLKKSSLPEQFVKKYKGNWNHQQWNDFCKKLKEEGYTPIDLTKVGQLLESLKNEN
ncbi:MAG: hypothetical protein K9M56_09735 [Victivallales bacterium]|nr:hypothetical protein [Victivallales bacterium]